MERNPFESAYKSKTVRVLALAVAIFGGGIFESHREKSEEQRTIAVATEMLKTERIQLEDLASKFIPEVQIPDGEKTILHIGQTHAIEDIEKDKKETKKIIAVQKHIEELLLYLTKKGISDTVFLEGIRPEDKELWDILKDTISHNLNSQDEAVGKLMNLSLQVEQMQTSNTSERKMKACLLYIVKCGLDREYQRMKKAYDVFKKTGHSDDPFYQKKFEQFEKMNLDVNRTLENMKLRSEQISANELISGDNVYLWGAAEKMYAEDKIKIEPAESQEARNKTDAPYSWGEKLLVPLLGPKHEQRHRIREDSALGFMGNDISSEKVIPLIYGEGHNFTGSVEEFNHKSGSRKFGLTKLTPE